VGYPKEANAGILVKRLNRRKFRPDATSFLAMGSSLYITDVGGIRFRGEDARRVIQSSGQDLAKVTTVSADQAGVSQNKLQKQAVRRRNKT
jgi:hypothetical protein